MSQIVKLESSGEFCASENWLKVSAYEIPKSIGVPSLEQIPDQCFGNPRLSSTGFRPVSFDGPRVRPQGSWYRYRSPT
jgi:hypothetical protein